MLLSTQKSIPFDSPFDVKEQRAFENMQRAVDMQEIFERVGPKHGSFLPHGAVYKVTQDILEVADVWAVSSSPLEALTAVTKRTARDGGSSRLELSTSGTMTLPSSRKEDKPTTVVATKGYSTTLAISVLKKLLAMNYLREGSGVASIPDSRRRERLIQTGRLTLPMAPKLPVERGGVYDPRSDSCLKAFVRKLSERAAAV